MKDESILMRNFREYYKPDTWFMNENKQIVLSSVRQGFTLSSARFPELCRTARRLVKPLEHGGEYVVYDVYEHSVSPASDSQEKELLRVFTHVFKSVDEAREGYFYLLWGAVRLKGRNEGILDVGEVSYGQDKYLCFLRNNTVIRIFFAGIDTQIIKEFAKRADKQIIEKSK